MPNNGKKQQASALNEAQQRAITMVATGATGRDIAAALGVNECTVSRWKQSAEFEAAVNALLSDAKAAAANQLRNLADQAVGTIAAVMTDATANPADRLKAAALVLDRVGLTTVPSIGSTDAERIESDRAAAARDYEIFNTTW